MLTVENEYFIRLLLLIFKAGTLVLRQVLMKKLEEDGLQLTAFLHVNKEQIDKLKEEKVLTLKQYTNLFPSNGKETNLDNYDISLLSCLLLNIFSRPLETSEKKAIETIRTLRNELPAHHPHDSIDVRTFFRKWNQLHLSINNLGNGLIGEQRSALEEIIRSVGEDPIDIRHVIKYIKNANGDIDQFIEHVSRQLENLSHLVHEMRSRQEETYMDIKELQQKCENRNKSIIIIGEVTITSDNPEAALTAARILLDDAKKCTRSSKNSSIINGGRKKTTNDISSFNMTSDIGATNAESKDTEAPADAFIQGINDTGGVIVDITQGSVLLHIQCESVIVLFRVVKYFQSLEIEQRLNDIAKYLTKLVAFDVHLTANIRDESLQEALHLSENIQDASPKEALHLSANIQDASPQETLHLSEMSHDASHQEALRYLHQECNQEYTTKIRFSIQCQNADEVANVVKVMESGETTTKMSAISNDLSKKVGHAVTLRSSVDKDPLQQYIVENRDRNEYKEETEKAAVNKARPEGIIENLKFGNESTDDCLTAKRKDSQTKANLLRQEKDKDMLLEFKRRRLDIEQRSTENKEPHALMREEEEEKEEDDGFDETFVLECNTVEEEVELRAPMTKVNEIETEMSKKMSNAFLADIASLFGMGYKLFFVSEGIPPDRISEIEIDLSKSVKYQVIELLYEWRKIKGTEANIDALRSAIIQNPHVTVNMNNFDKLVKKHQAET